MKINQLLFLSAAALLGACKGKNEPQVSTYAGNGKPDMVNGTSANASFSNPMGLALDSSGNQYVADSRNNCIRMITPGGDVTTLAGSGKQGNSDGKGGEASFFFPGAIASDAHGTVYVADTHNNRIRKITSDGTVSTIAGLSTPEIEKHRDTVVKLSEPYGIAVDKTGTVFFTDWQVDQVKKIGPDGRISVVAGSGQRGKNDGRADKASFYLPEGIAIDQNGNLYVADTYNNCIRKITADGIVSTLAGRGIEGFADGEGKSALFAQPDGIAVDHAGNVYVADVGNNRIRKITPDGKVSTLAGSGVRGLVNGPASAAQFYRPYGLAFDKQGNLYVADYQNNVIRKITF